MELTRLLRKSAAVPLRVAEAAANITAGVIAGSVRFAGTPAAVVVGGVGLATAPVRAAASVLSDVAESHSPGSLVREFVGGTPARRSSRSGPGVD
jgi:FlaG/FlaF family flagellin (archaellin)